MRDYLKALLLKLLRWLGERPVDSDETALAKAQILLIRAAESGRKIDDKITTPILAALSAQRQNSLTSEQINDFYEAYAVLVSKTADISKRSGMIGEFPFEDAVSDSEQLLKYASEKGATVQADVIQRILTARAELAKNTLADPTRAAFYSAYASLSHQFGEVTAETIRNCASQQAHWRLRRDRTIAVLLSLAVAAISVTTFVADSMSKQIVADISTANEMAAKLRAGLNPDPTSPQFDVRFAKEDPCTLQTTPISNTPSRAISVEDVTHLQQFAATNRNIYGRAIKLNKLLTAFVFPELECDPYHRCEDRAHDANVPNPEVLKSYLQVNPAIINYSAEALCKIKVYQSIRDFASNVQSNYTVMIGAFISYGLPILYSILGAYAYRLRLFADQIQKRVYFPSFADSARLITAVIAGAIAGLFNPAQGLALSPLATAFLVGYGVELFFRFLDNLINAFGRSTPSAKPASQANG